MKKNNVTKLVQPGEFKDHLTEILRQGARNLVLQAVEAEFASFCKATNMKSWRMAQGHLMKKVMKNLIEMRNCLQKRRPAWKKRSVF